MREPKTISILGCGWLGLPLGAYLAERGHRVRGSTTTPEKRERLAAAGIEPYLLRLDPERPHLDAGAFFEADVLFLNVPPPRRRPDVLAYHLAQVDLVREAVRTAGAGFVVFASSTSVYPELNREVTEDEAGGVDSETGQALLAAERLLLEDPAFETTVLRFAGLYGGDRQPGRWLAGRRNVDNGGAPVNLVHRDDAIAVVMTIIEQDVRGDVFNVCTDAHPTRAELYTHKARQLGLDPPVFADASATSFKIVSNEKLKARLDYRFVHPDPMEG